MKKKYYIKSVLEKLFKKLKKKFNKEFSIRHANNCAAWSDDKIKIRARCKQLGKIHTKIKRNDIWFNSYSN